jgi:hypothetical protein
MTFSHLSRWEERRRIRALYTTAVREAIPEDPVAELEEALPPELVQWPGLHRALHLEWGVWLGGRRPGAVLAAAGMEVELPWLAPPVLAAAAARSPAAVLRRAPRGPRASPAGELAGNALEACLDIYLAPERVAAGGLFDPERVQRLHTRWRLGYRLTAGDRLALLAVATTGLWVEHCLGSAGRVSREMMA